MAMWLTAAQSKKVDRICNRHRKINESIPSRYNTMEPLVSWAWGSHFSAMARGGEETHRLRFRRGIVYVTINITENADRLIQSEYHIKIKTTKGGFSKAAYGEVKGNRNPVPIAVQEADQAWEDNKVEDLPSAPVTLKPYNTTLPLGGRGHKVQCEAITGATVRGLGRVLPNKEVEELDAHNPREFENALFIVGVSTLNGAYRLILTDGEGWAGLNNNNGILKLSNSQKAIGEVQYMSYVDKFIINKAIELFFEE